MKNRISSLSLFALFLSVSLLSCGRSFDIEGSSLLSYAEGGAEDAITLNLSRDKGSILGSWEEPAWARYGLVEGEAKADGSLTLRFFAASTAGPVAGLVGKYAEGEKRIEGKLSFGDEAARTVSLAVNPAVTEGLSQDRVEGNSRENLAKTVLDPTRFIYVGFEPSGPAALTAWYRATFQGGRGLKEAMNREKNAFLEDFKETGTGLKAQAADIDIAPWFYEGRQVLCYRSKGLLVMALRRQSYTGGKDSSGFIRHAVIDEQGCRMLGPGDFLVEGWEKELPALLAASAREEIGIEESTPLAQAGLASEAPEPSADFFVYSRGLGFHYRPGELAPENAGEFFLLLPFDRLGKLVNAEALARFGLAVQSEAASQGAGGSK